MRRRRALSDEERRLWGEIARTARPLPGKSLPPALGDSLAAGPPPDPVVPTKTKGTAGGAVSRAALPALWAAAGPKPAPPVLQPPGLHPIERPVRRRLGKGRIPIEDRIDLHGRTEALAHVALLGFLRRAQGSGLRHVLVITGRGASFGSRGVLKRAMPHWFSTPEFRALVAGYEPAERNHGGDGAFYVRVRRK